MSDYYILGHGGFANEILEQVFLQNDTDKNFTGFVTLVADKAMLMSEEGITEFKYPLNAKFIIGTGNKKWRNKFLIHFLNKYRETEEHFPNIINETAHVSKLAELGIGNVFCPQTLVNGDAVVGNFNLFNVGSGTHHDTKIGDYNIFSPNSLILGRVTIKDFNFIAAGAVITPKVTIGSHNVLSAGEYLFDDMQNKQFFQSGIISDKK